MEYLNLFDKDRKLIGKLTSEDGHLTVDLDESSKAMGQELNKFLEERIGGKKLFTHKAIKRDDKIIETREPVETQEALLRYIATAISRQRFSFGRVFAILNKTEEES